MLNQILNWMIEDGATGPGDVNARRIRAYLAHLMERDISDSYINGYARVIRTFVRFLADEEYIEKPVKFKMPPIRQKRLLSLSAEQVQELVEALPTHLEKAIALFIVDTGIRRAELVALNWEDVDLNTGVVRIKRGKGGKYRTVVVGANTRRALMRYRRKANQGKKEPVFQNRSKRRFSGSGINSMFARWSKNTEIKVTPHALRRTFATLSLRAGMNLIHLQGLMGHATIEMTRNYITILDDDLVAAHQEHGPVDKYLRSR